MAPDLAVRLARFHDGLSPGTVRRRFFSAHPHLSTEELYRFTNVDHVDREALVVLDADGEIVAVGRFDRLAPGASTAEVAFVVTDAWQHRGVGGALFAQLAAGARAVGVTQFVAETLAENRAMRAVFRHAGYPVEERLAGGIATVRIDLAGPA